MKRAEIILFFKMLSFCLAQIGGGNLYAPKELLNTCHSATAAGVPVYFHFDFQDTLNDSTEISPVSSAAVYVSTDGGSSWIGCPATRVGPPGYDSTYQAIFTSNPASGTVLYWYELRTDSSVTCWAPNNSTDAFPPADNQMVHIVTDPASDQRPFIMPYTAEERYYTNTDMREFWVGYSPTKYYARMTVAGGGFPFNVTEQVDNPNSCPSWAPYRRINIRVDFFYVFPIVNPRAPYPDSIFYTALYGDATLMGVHFYTGLYKFYKLASGATIFDYLNSYDRLGDIEANVSGNTLNIRFNWSQLTSDGDFGPLATGDIILTGGGITSLSLFPKDPSCYVPSVNDTSSIAFNDGSPSVGFYRLTGSYTVAPSGAPPVLSDYGGSYAKDGLAYAWFYCTYTDPDGDLPTIREVVIDGTPYQLGSSDHTYFNGSQFSRHIDVTSAGNFFFRFSDGANIVTTPPALLGLNEKNSSFEILPIEFFPNPFNLSCAIFAPASAEIEIFDLSGRKVWGNSPQSVNHSQQTYTTATLKGRSAPEDYRLLTVDQFIWTPEPSVKSGIYLVRAKIGEQIVMKRVALIR